MKILERDPIKVKVDDVKDDITNPNKLNEIQMNGIRESMKRFGFLHPITVDEHNMIADGWHRVLVYKEFGLEFIPAYKVEFKDESERRLFRQTMNKLRGEHDKDLDAAEMRYLFENDKLDDLSILIAKDKDSIQQFLERKYDDLHFDKQEEVFDIDQEVPPIAKPGDMWKLGNHRLLCGDCTKKEDVDKLLNGVKVDLLLTDPPYGVDYSSKNEFLNTMDKGNRIQKDIKNDALSNLGYRDFFASFLKLVPFADYNIFYIFMSGFALHYLRLALDDTQLFWGDYLLWVKNNHVLGRKDYNSKHEFIVYGWKQHHRFYGPFGTTVLEYNKPQISDLHPVMKPIELLTKLIDDGSQKDMIVYDPFLGSGSTLIACEQKQRYLFGLEIDPHYTDVCIARWEKYSGKKAQKL